MFAQKNFRPPEFLGEPEYHNVSGVGVAPVANRAMLIAAVLYQRQTFSRLYIVRLSSAGLASDLGIYDASFNRLRSTGAGLQGTGPHAIAPVTLEPGLYWLAMSVAGAGNGYGLRALPEGRALMADGAHPLPANLVPVAPASNMYAPLALV